jgi:membrane protein
MERSNTNTPNSSRTVAAVSSPKRGILERFWSSRAYRLLSAFFTKFDDDRTMTLASSLSFYTILSLAPLSVVILFAFSRLDPTLLDRFILEARNLVGEGGSGAIEASIESARSQKLSGTVATFVSLLVVLVSASAMFGEIRASLAILLRSPPQPPLTEGFYKKTWAMVRDRLLSIGFALTFVLIMAVSLVISAVLSATAQELGFARIEMPLSFLLYSTIFTLLLMYGAKKGLPFRDAVRGGVLTGALFIIGKTLIGLYIGNSTVASSYGAAGSVVALLVWVYYAVIIVFSGAHVAWLLSKKHYLRYEQQPAVTISPLRRPQRKPKYDKA